eukprot:CAMPEP_0185259070 /NCGR_PEP_ID=MMETSP1359-20130426/7915_1 /TAXON_ID=552665 /ORGANISM="Bigelowiella longifila, Strain CCMP242" /LENGTH=236 /DNA_ID=CAMNT_0027844847 /DNA_START=52 /DNA_END=762 /DNA_ORIENTATION=-
MASARHIVVDKAAAFLRNPNVQKQSQDKQLAFLYKKGVTPLEAQMAFQRLDKEKLARKDFTSKSSNLGSSQSESEKKNKESQRSIFASIRSAIGSLILITGEEEQAEMVGKLNLADLSQFNGVLHERLLVSVEGKIYDVTRRWDLYGPGKKYNVFAGNDATYALATMSTEKKSMNKFDVVLNKEQKEILGEWIAKYKENKYPVVGNLTLENESKPNSRSCDVEQESVKETKDKTNS